MAMSNVEARLGDEIARVRHGQDVTASDLANRLMPFINAIIDEEREKCAQTVEQEKPEENTDYEFQSGFYAGVTVAAFQIRAQK